MSVSVCPTVMTDDPRIFQAQMEELTQYATRVHIDLGDGVFTKKFLDISDVWWPGGMRADLHIMYQRPFEYINEFIALGPQLVIVHAESEGDYRLFANTLHQHGIEVGLALLQETPVQSIVPALDITDHVLIFAGSLGQNAGSTNLAMVEKAAQLRQLKPQLEIGWDGGANDTNARQLADGGIDVINCGGYLHGDDPAAAYEKILRIVNGEPTKKFHL